MDIPENRPIAFLNKGLESVFQYDGYFPHKSESIDPVGITYDFYYGNVNIFVNLNSIQSDFGRMSISTRFLNGNDYWNFKITDKAILKLIISAYPRLSPDDNITKNIILT